MSVSPLPHGQWIPLMDYAMKNGVSLSTLRRHIKAGKVRYKSENGKYLIYSEGDGSSALLNEEPRRLNAGVGQGKDLATELLKAREEIAELKMLVALYEERLFQKRS